MRVSGVHNRSTGHPGGRPRHPDRAGPAAGLAPATLTAIPGSDREWLAAFEAAGTSVRASIGQLLGTEAGRSEVGIGAGGDRTVELDRLAEVAALAELTRFARSGHPCSVLSEEAGPGDPGAGYSGGGPRPLGGRRHPQPGP